MYSLLCFPFSLLSFRPPVLLIKVWQPSRDGHVGMLLSLEEAMQQGSMPGHKLFKHVL